MRVIVVGASGNVGTSLLKVLADEPAVESVLAIARRLPELEVPKTVWARADVTRDELAPLFRGADALVHLAWAIQPSHDRDRLWRVNVEGSTRVFRAVADAGVPALVYASSVGAYAPGPKHRPVDESWPVGGVATSFYGRQKAEVERRLDRFENEHPRIRVVRLRPGLIFKREAASEVRRLFAGPFLPSRLVRPSLIPVLPEIPGLRFQALHSLDVAEAYRLAIVRKVRGAFNVAADPPLDLPSLARLLDARTVRVPVALARVAMQLSWRLRLQPSEVGWLDLALAVPLLDTSRARSELGWSPTCSSEEAFLELLGGIRDEAGLETPPLEPEAGGPLRVRELATRVGGSEDV